MDYYQKLGVAYTASHEEIKRAYRRLAVQYHPDKNKDPQAESLFKEINEAYDVLGDPAKKTFYDLKFSSPFTTTAEPERPRHKDPAYRTNRPRTKRKSDRDRLGDLMVEYLPWVIKLSYLCLVVAGLLLLDYVIPSQVHDEKIINYKIRRVPGFRYTVPYAVITTTGDHVIDVNPEFSDHFLKGKEVVVYSSMLLNIPVKIASAGFAVKLRKSIYGNFVFAPFGLFFFAALSIFFRKNVRHGFNFGITTILFLILTCAFLII